MRSYCQVTVIAYKIKKFQFFFMGDQARPENKVCMQWAPDAASMVELEALCASLQAHPSEAALHLTLSIGGDRPPKFSELKKLLSLLEPVVRDGAFFVHCERLNTQKLLEFCGFSLIAKIVKDPLSVSHFANPESESAEA